MPYRGVVNNLVGEKLYGFCDGYFGRDSYSDKEIIMNGFTWVVAISDNEIPEIAHFDSNLELMNWFEVHSRKSQSYNDYEDEEDEY